MSSNVLARPVDGSQVRLGVAAAATLAVALAALWLDPAQGWPGLLTAGLFGTSLALGGALFLAIPSASGARWHLPLAPVAARLAGALGVPLVAVGVCLVLGLPALYPWARPEVVEHSLLLQEKAAWLNAPLFLARALAIATAWLIAVAALGSRACWAARDTSPSSRRESARAAIAFLIVFAVTFSVASWDWAMSLEPEWFSTMYAVYGFAGAFLGGIAAVSVLALLRERSGARLGPDTLHDLGKLLFAFATFWAYIWFCQYLLIWYANLPEETEHYVTRFAGGWSMLFWLNPILNFVVPFVVLLGVGPKRHGAALFQVSLVVLLGRWVDTYLMVAPPFGPVPSIPVAATAASLGILAGMAMLATRPEPA